MHPYAAAAAFVVGLILLVCAIRLENKPRTSFDDVSLIKPVYLLMPGIVLMLFSAAYLLFMLMRKA